MSVLSRPEFHDEAKAFEHLERIIWADGRTCPHCGGMDRITKVTANPEKRIRVGLWRCGHCKGQFTVKVGTVFEHMRLPLNKAMQAVYLMTSSKKGISAHQLHRTLEVTYKTAWFLAHRIREAMRSGDLAPFGGEGSIVEVDETFIGRVKGSPIKRAYHHKMKVLALVDRATGKSRAMVIDNVHRTVWQSKRCASTRPAYSISAAGACRTGTSFVSSPNPSSGSKRLWRSKSRLTSIK